MSALRAIAGAARWCLPACGFALLLPLATPPFDALPATLAWGLDLATHWQFAYAAAWLALCLLCTLRGRRWLWLAPAALLPLWTASPALPRASNADRALIVVAANVHVGNRDPGPLAAWLRAQPADVVAISELTPAYADALLRTLGDDYPYRAFAPDTSAFGIGLLARRPLTDVDLRRSDDGIPQLRAMIAAPAGPVRIVAVHPVPPMSAHWHAERDRLLHALADETVRDGTPTIVAGDLNATPWSSALTGAGRRGLYRAGGFAPTWPTGRTLIPIDHVLASADWRRGESARGPEIGSDHRPIRVTLHRAPSRP